MAFAVISALRSLKASTIPGCPVLLGPSVENVEAGSKERPREVDEEAACGGQIQESKYH